MNFLLMTIALIFISLLLISAFILLFLQQKKGKKMYNQIAEKEGEFHRLNQELSSLQEQVKLVESKDDGEKESERLKSGIELTLKKALKRAEEENFQKNSFLSNLSSEIRTPLNNIVGFASLLETETSLIENKELFEYAR
ncbi:MAG: hypothetical protein HQ542_01340, partial [Bacteroidia bacterium]|nr:hypothetical protein [Bacteroidia bacterium]